MRKRVLIIVAALVFIASVSLSAGNRHRTVSVMSYNIRIALVSDGINSWENRSQASAMMIEDKKPDVIGLQEALIGQMTDLDEALPGYRYIGVGCDDGKEKGGIDAILYNTETMRILKSGTFWLSDTPEMVSKGWDGAYYRAATWAVMKSRSGKKFVFVNTHLDNEGAEAREKGLALIVDKIAEINTGNYPVVLTGDFNMEPDDSAMSSVRKAMKDSREAASSTDKKGTYHNWGKLTPGVVIDYIWFSGFGSCTSFERVTKEYDGRAFISDHFPVKATFLF